MPAPAPDRFLITGCASGIGRALAEEVVRRSHRLIATDLDVEALRDEAEQAGWPAERCLIEPLDVRDPDAWSRVTELAANWQGLDVLLNVAGYMRPAEVYDLRDVDVHRHLDVNVKGLIFGTRAAARQMIRQGHGHIVNIASLAALAPIPGIPLYCASKYAARAFSLAAAEELRPHGVAVTAVCPDAVRTPMFDRQLSFPEAALTFTAPRVFTAEDVALLILGKVLRQRPLEIAFPRRRAWLARLANLFPSISRLLVPAMRRQGLLKQEAWRQRLKSRAAGVGRRG